MSTINDPQLSATPLFNKLFGDDKAEESPQPSAVPAQEDSVYQPVTPLDDTEIELSSFQPWLSNFVLDISSITQGVRGMDPSLESGFNLQRGQSTGAAQSKTMRRPYISRSIEITNTS